MIYGVLLQFNKINIQYFQSGSTWTIWTSNEKKMQGNEFCNDVILNPSSKTTYRKNWGLLSIMFVKYISALRNRIKDKKIYWSVQNKTSKVLHTYVMNELLRAWRSYKTKYFWKKPMKTWSPLWHHYVMGLEPNWKKIPQNSRKQIRIPEGM